MNKNIIYFISVSWLCCCLYFDCCLYLLFLFGILLCFVLLWTVWILLLLLLFLFCSSLLPFLFLYLQFYLSFLSLLLLLHPPFLRFPLIPLPTPIVPFLHHQHNLLKQLQYNPNLITLYILPILILIFEIRSKFLFQFVYLSWFYSEFLYDVYCIKFFIYVLFTGYLA